MMVHRDKPFVNGPKKAEGLDGFCTINPARLSRKSMLIHLRPNVFLIIIISKHTIKVSFENHFHCT